MHLLYPLVLSALLFAIGIYGLLARRNAVLVLMSVELMLNAVNLDLVAFDAWLRDTLHSGQVFALFVITIAAAEVGIGLAIVLQVFRLRATVAIDELDDLTEPDNPPHHRAEPGTIRVDHDVSSGDHDVQVGQAGTNETAPAANVMIDTAEREQQ